LEYAIGLTVVILKVAVGLGFVIFVHELGHFAVAKLCGVKCEKFYLGFDIAGLKFCKFRYGETEYGIGILPLGGYVKMLGQEDNPAKLREEMERAKQKAEGGEGRGESASQATNATQGLGTSVPSEPGRTNASSAPLESPVYDPRSFLAKSVPKRMAIISAGVIMNLIFAFLMCVVAFGIGVTEPPCVVGEVHAGEAAWQAGLRSGDEILEIGGKKMEQFEDLKTAIALGSIDPKKGVPFRIRRDGTIMDVTLKPDNSLGIFAIGVSGQYTTRLLPDHKTWLVFNRHAVIPGSAADRATPAFCNGDRFVRIDDTPIEDYSQINSELARKAGRKIVVTVERAEKDAEGKPTSVVRRVETAVEPEPMRDLGLIMATGTITAVQAGSPAESAGILPGDRLFDPGDPMTLPDRLARQAGKTIELKLEREKGKEPIVCSVRLREPAELTPSVFRNSPVGVPALGIAYRVLNKVERVTEGSPADKAGMKPGDVIVQAKMISPNKASLQELGVDPTEEDLVGARLSWFGGEHGGSVDFGDKDQNWPSFVNALQTALPGTKIELTFLRNGQRKTLPTPQQPPMELVTTNEAYNAERGFRFEQMTILARAHSLGQMFALGGVQTLKYVTVVFRTVRALGTGQVPMTGLGGPVMIVKIAMGAADQGLVKFLMFLAFLSANLAVLNFLPIPVLDGGHFVLLAYEGIRGKPANEHVQTVLAYIGLAFILALMIWVFGLDFGWISRH
jgi:regulator of sigma E protease